MFLHVELMWIGCEFQPMRQYASVSSSGVAHMLVGFAWVGCDLSLKPRWNGMDQVSDGGQQMDEISSCHRWMDVMWCRGEWWWQPYKKALTPLGWSMDRGPCFAAAAVLQLLMMWRGSCPRLEYSYTCTTICWKKETLASPAVPLTGASWEQHGHYKASHWIQPKRKRKEKENMATAHFCFLKQY